MLPTKMIFPFFFFTPGRGRNTPRSIPLYTTVCIPSGTPKSRLIARFESSDTVMTWSSRFDTIACIRVG